MKYHSPEQLMQILSRMEQVAEAAAQGARLRFRLRDGQVFEGKYEETVLGVNDKGLHSLAARIVITGTDYPYPVELAEVLAVESAGK